MFLYGIITYPSLDQNGHHCDNDKFKIFSQMETNEFKYSLPSLRVSYVDSLEKINHVKKNCTMQV